VHGARAELGGFRKFLLRGNVVDLAVGVVIGAAFASVVQSIVKGIITPLVGAFSGGIDLSGLTFSVGRATFLIGDVLNALISFVLIALVVYFFVVAPVTRLMDRYKPEAPPAPTKNCPECTTKIPEAARRCPFCTTQLLAPSDEVSTLRQLQGSSA
jgi:large conductance mechanosensitive channel